MVHISLLGTRIGLPLSKATMNVSIHEDNAGDLVLVETLPPQFTPRNKYYAIETICSMNRQFWGDQTAQDWHCEATRRYVYQRAAYGNLWVFENTTYGMVHPVSMHSRGSVVIVWHDRLLSWTCGHNCCCVIMMVVVVLWSQWCSNAT
jgi:hypothetical protein